MNSFQYITLFGLAGNLIIGFVVWGSNPLRKLNQYFLVTTFFIVFWLLGLFLTTLQSSGAVLTIISRQVSLAAGLLPLGFFILYQIIREPQLTLRHLILKLRYLFLAVMSVAILCQTDFFLTSAYFSDPSETVPVADYGPGFALYILYFISMAIGMGIAVRNILRSSSGVQRQESQFLLLGWLMGFITGVSLFTVANLSGTQEATRFMPLVPLVMNSFVAYGIATRRILSVPVVLQRVISIGLMAVYLTGVYIFAVWAGRALLKWVVSDPTYLSHLLAALAVAFSVAPAHGRMQAVSHRLFASSASVNRDELLTQAGRIFQEVTTETKLMENFSRLIERSFETVGAVLLRPEGSGVCLQMFPQQAGGNAISLPASSAAIQLLMKEHEPLTVDVLERMWPSAQVVCAREELAAQGAAAVAGGFSRKELKAVLMLAPKSSGAIYDARDQQILQLLCDQFAAALENARLYTEVQNSKIYSDILIDSLASGMVAVNSDRTVTVFNQRAQSLTGLRDAVGSPFDRLPEPLPEVLDTLLKNQAGFRDRDLTLHLNADTAVPVRASGSVFRSYTGDLLGALLVFNDMTALRKMEEQMRRTDRLSSLGTLSAGMAHEIKNPLVTIKTFTQLLPHQHSDPDFQRTFFELVGQEVQRIDSIVNQLLNYARPAKAALRAIPLHDVIENSLRLTGQQMVQQNIRLERHLHAPRCVIQGDAELLTQTFVNFFLNAIQAMGTDGTLTVRTSVMEAKSAISLIRDAQPARISVEIRDTGCGIAPDEITRIFDPFFTTKDGGVGLGLSVSHQIIQEHNGTVDVESAPDEGTVFYLQFPLAEEAAGGGEG